MKLKSLGYLATLSLTMLTQTTFAANDSITYKNAQGSILTLEFGPANTLSGTFITAVASKDCQQAIGTKKNIQGAVANNVITFSAKYPECNAVVSFVGSIDNNRATIDTTAMISPHSTLRATVKPVKRSINHEVFIRV